MASLLLAVIYVAFISLGLPDAMLGAAWPSMSQELGAPLPWAGGISMTICAGTIVSALLSDRMTSRFGAGKVTAVSVGLTAAALAGFSLAPNYWVLLAIAVPYGLGAGGVDAALNNYVAVHYESRHMSWLHAMWGLGMLAGPYVMGLALSHGQGWGWGYRYIAIIQVVLTALLVLSLPLWKGRNAAVEADGSRAHAPAPRRPGLLEVLGIRGAKGILVMFFCYCAIESTAMLWASSYMVLGVGVDKTTAAMWASFFGIGITVGRLLSGVLTMRFDDPTMIRRGQGILFVGIVLLPLPLPHHIATITGLMLVGLGCAPIYPCVIHSTPAYFGEDKSQAIIGMQMACAYMGSMVMPALFGVMAQYVTISLLPWYLLLLLTLMVAMHESLRRAHANDAA